MADKLFEKCVAATTTFPTRQSIMELGTTDPIVHRALQLWLQGHGSFEQCLLVMVTVLVDVKNDYAAQLLDAVIHRNPPPVVIPRGDDAPC